MVAIVVIAASAGGLDPLRRSLLNRDSQHPAMFAQDGILIEAGHIYVAPPDHHMLLAAYRITWGIVLSGGDGDGAAGLRTIRERGGTAIVQDPEEAAKPSMPLSALVADHPDASLPVAEIAQRVRVFCSRSAVIVEE